MSKFDSLASREAARRDSDLRSLIGERYQILIGSTDSIVEMGIRVCQLSEPPENRDGQAAASRIAEIPSIAAALGKLIEGTWRMEGIRFIAPESGRSPVEGRGGIREERHPPERTLAEARFVLAAPDLVCTTAAATSFYR